MDRRSTEQKSYISVGHMRRECINRTLRRVDAGLLTALQEGGLMLVYAQGQSNTFWSKRVNSGVSAERVFWNGCCGFSFTIVTVF